MRLPYTPIPSQLCVNASDLKKEVCSVGNILGGCYQVKRNVSVDILDLELIQTVDRERTQSCKFPLLLLFLFTL